MPANDGNSSKQSMFYVILGSGGHTAEMSKIMQAILASGEANYLNNRIKYVVADSDKTSRTKLQNSLSQCDGGTVTPEDFIEVPRSRQVGQSWLTTVFTTMWALLWSFWFVWRDRPTLILCNGPGTCVPFCMTAYLLRFLRRLPARTKIVFVESFCRVQSLSLSGRLLLPVADMFVVQWPALMERYGHNKNVQFFGRLM